MNQSSHKVQQELKTGQASNSLWLFTPRTHLICLVSLHNPGSKASQNQSKHEPRIIEVYKARSLRSWRCVGASTKAWQRDGWNDTVGRNSLWATRNTALYNISRIRSDVLDLVSWSGQKYNKPCLQMSRMLKHTNFSHSVLRQIMQRTNSLTLWNRVEGTNQWQRLRYRLTPWLLGLSVFTSESTRAYLPRTAVTTRHL